MLESTVAAQIGVTAVLILFCLLVPSVHHGSHQHPRQAPHTKPVDLTVPRPLTGQVGLYPRVVRLAHSGSANGRILASVISSDGKNGLGAIFESRNNGASFTQVATITDPDAATSAGICCGTLFELPRQVGPDQPGTLLWAASMGQRVHGRRMSIRLWKSGDHGRTWSYLSSPAVATTTRGLWEPELSVDALGRLVCYYSDEGEAPRHSQILNRVLSNDGGTTWVDRTPTVVSPLRTDRPGMATVRDLPDGTYVMSYEICTKGGEYKCVVHIRTSTDGWNWGDPAYLGTEAKAPDGAYFEHAPTIAWSPAGGPGGSLLLVGQLFLERDGSRAPLDGRVMLVNTHDGSGPWAEVPAPVPVGVAAHYDACSNYSSALLPSTNGSAVMEIASHYTSTGGCQADYATTRLG
jgi:hypothetical protein